MEAASQERGDAGSAFTACWEGIAFTQPAADKVLMGNGLNGSSNSQYVLYSNTSTVKATISTANCSTGTTGTLTATTPAAPTDGQHSLICLNYNEGGDNKYRIYIDGVQAAVSSAQATICGGKSGARHTLLGRWATTAISTAAVNPATLGGFYTEKAITAAELVTLTTALLADTPTGSKGEVLTAVRNSAAGAPNGAGTVSNVVRANKARIGNGGLLNEEARTNLQTKSEDIGGTGSWTLNCPAPTVDYAIGPNNTYNAERFQFAATSGASSSYVYSDAVSCTGNTAASFWIKGTSGSGTLDYCTYPSGVFNCDAVSYTTEWRRIVKISTAAAAPGYVVIGNASNLNGNVSRSANDVLITQAQCELGAFATSYMPTTNAPATRLAEATYLVVSISSDVSGSMAATYVSNLGSAENAIVSLSASGGSYRRLLDNVAGVGLRLYAPTSSVTATTAGTGTHRVSAFWEGSGSSATVIGGSTATGSINSGPNQAEVELGSYSHGANPINGVVKLVCIDPSPSRCR
jgi:hypothetical protein